VDTKPRGSAAELPPLMKQWHRWESQSSDSTRTPEQILYSLSVRMIMTQLAEAAHHRDVRCAGVAAPRREEYSLGASGGAASQSIWSESDARRGRSRLIKADIDIFPEMSLNKR
jgi:hypothetical protein